MSNYFGSQSKGSNNAFGVVTVMDVHVFDYEKVTKQFIEAVDATPATVATALKLEVAKQGSAYRGDCFINHMQVATLSTDGPNITIQGGRFNNNLIKYGKTARCEMTDALGQADALVALGGAEVDSNGVISITDKFGAAKTLVGKTFVVDQKTGKHVDATVILYKFLPDSTPSFAFDSGNAATFDLNGDLLAVELAGAGVSGNECGDGNGYFFSIIDDGCDLTPEGSKTVPVEHTDDILVAPSSATRMFAQTTQPNYASVVAASGVSPVVVGYKADGTAVSGLGVIANDQLTLQGSAVQWDEVVLLRIERSQE